MIVLALRSDFEVALVEPSSLVCVADTISRTTAAINAARNTCGAMSNEGFGGTGRFISCSL